MSKSVKDTIGDTVKQITSNYESNSLFTSKDNKKQPSRAIIISMIKDLRTLMFPGYFGDENIHLSSPEYFVGQVLTEVYEKLFTQTKIALAYFDDEHSTEEIEEQATEICQYFFENIPKVQKMLMTDVEALFQGDPAAKGKEEVIISYPGLFAIYVYRFAHLLYQKNVPLIPRIMTEYAHSRTGIDIHAGAKIDEYFFIDHGTGIVIGETTEIGKNVKLYQGVTLGGLSTRGGQRLAGVKRHPTIEDNVTIYSGASILGGDTVIGKNTTVGGNTFVVESINEGSRVKAKTPELDIKIN